MTNRPPTAPEAERQAGAAMADMLAAARLTFTFPPHFPPSQEAAYRADFARRFLSYRRMAMVLGLVLWVAYVPWDFLHHARHPEVFTAAVLSKAMWVRGAVLLVLLALVGSSFTDRFCRENFATATLLAGNAAVWAGLLALGVVVIPSPFNYLFYMPGVDLVTFYLFAFTHVRSRPATLLAVLVAMSLVALQSVHGTLDPEYLAPIACYYVIVLLVCLGVSVKFERYGRERFLKEAQLANLIDDEKAAHERANAERQSSEEKTELLVRIKEQQRHDAERANADKSLFLAHAAHDLGQPIQALSNHLTVSGVALGQGRYEVAQQSIDAAQRATSAMRVMFTALLEVSRLESGLVTPRLADVDLDDVLEDVASAIELIAADRGVTVRVRRSARQVIVRTDRELLTRVATNLAINAIKYSDPSKVRPRVLLAAVQRPGRALLHVVDNGIGIPRHHWDKIFKPLFQVNNAQRDSAAGIGLGLAIVNAALSLLPQHRVDMDSTEGRGSRFSVEVPLTQSSPRTSVAGALPNAPMQQLSGCYVLVVEDDPDVRASFGALLRQYGVLSESVTSAEELEVTLRGLERDPDVLITDYRLPNGKSAVDVIDLMRRNWDYVIPSIVVTGELGPLAALEGYADTVVVRKPVDPAALLQLLASRVSGRPEGN